MSKFVPVGTGPAVWDDPYVDQLIHRFMPHDRKHGPMLGVLHMGAVRPTPGVLRDLVVTVGEDVKAGRYGNFSLFICSEDEDTRSVIGDVAASRNVALFVCSSSADPKDAEPVGVLTAKDRETLHLVSQAGGTVTALSLAEQVNIEKTAAGNRLVTLQKKGYLQRVEQPHPAGDLFVDPRSVHLTSQERRSISPVIVKDSLARITVRPASTRFGPATRVNWRAAGPSHPGLLRVLR